MNLLDSITSFIDEKLDEHIKPIVVPKIQQAIHNLSPAEQEKLLIAQKKGDDALMDQVVKTTLQRELDIGKAPNVIPSQPANRSSEQRPVYIGSHPIGAEENYAWGELQKQFVESQAAGASEFPDPTWHWAIIVGPYFHELNGEWNFELNIKNVYQNGNMVNGKHKWKVFEVGTTRYNDEAIRLAGEDVIANKMNGPNYGLISNNCQNFVTKLIDTICDPGHQTAFPIQVIFQGGQVQNMQFEGKVGASYEASSASEVAAKVMKGETPVVR